MEDELWPEAYRVVCEEGKRQSRADARATYADGVIVLVLLWAASHDRPISWACAARGTGPGAGAGTGPVGCRRRRR